MPDNTPLSTHSVVAANLRPIFDNRAPGTSGQIQEKFKTGRRELVLNTLAISSLTIGYAVTTGTSIVDSESAKLGFRLAAISIILLNIILSRSIKLSVLFLVAILTPLAMINQSPLVINLIFLTVFFESFRRMTPAHIALALFIPSCLVIIFHQVGMLSGLLTITETNYGGRLRSAMGFNNPNQLAIMYLSLITCGMFLHLNYKSYKTFITLVIILITSFLMFAVSDSRTSIFSSAIMILTYITWKILSKFQGATSAFRLVSCFIFIVLNFLAFYMATPASSAMDEVLSFRPMMVKMYLGEASPAQYFYGWASESGGVDNSYIMWFSALGMPLYCIALIFAIIRIFKASPAFSPIYITLMISGLFEGFLIRPEIPAALLFLAVITISPHTVSQPVRQTVITT